MLSRLKAPAILCSLFAVSSGLARASDEEIDFNRDVRPILSDNCYYCHGPDEQEADIRLDIREDAIEAFAFVPGNVEDSELVYRIHSDDPEEMMPRPSTHKVLSAEEKETLTRWIEQGAPYDTHWSYKPVEKPDYESIDDVVTAQLRERDLSFSPEADPRTLIRRLYLDLIGLPPSLEETAAFLTDGRDDAYERLVDRLLASKRYGERMAIPWLDAVRYADTVGYHGDQARDATPYRDYVINAFNENKPFDEFTIEQIGGDLLPNATLEQKIAASYNRLNQISREGGIQDKEYIKKYQAERVRTISTTWLGSTLACAECHDHKFDPFTTKDFYSMAAFFADILEMGAFNNEGAYQEPVEPYLTSPLEHEGWFGPELTVPNETFHEKPEAVRAKIAEQEDALAEGSAEAEQEFADWLAQQKALSAKGIAPYQRLGDPCPSSKQNREYEPVHVGLANWALDETASLEWEARVVGGGGGLSTGMQVTFRTDGKLRSHTYRWGYQPLPDIEAENQMQVASELYKGVWHRLELSVETMDLPAGAELVSFRPLLTMDGDFRSFALRSLAFGSKTKALDHKESALLSAYLEGTATEGNLQALKESYFVAHADALSSERSEIAALHHELEGKRYTPLTVSATPREVKVLPRGNWMDESGEVVLPATPTFLPNAMASNERQRLDRLDLARWIVHPENPLTSRAFVNRVWAQFFGAALSSAPEDLGLQGEYPPYLDLLDFLAADFVENGWDIKRLVRSIVQSRTYRQSSDARPELEEVDPYNRLLARQSPRRLPAELIRDNSLAISGLLVNQLGGPSAKPAQPAGYYRHLNFPKLEYQPDTGPGQYRRGVYMHWQRTFLHPMLSAFDANGRDECSVKRDLSNTPQQALNLLNDPTQIEAAQAFAKSLLGEGTGDATRIMRAFQTALARSPTSQEFTVLRAFLERERERFRNDPSKADAFLQQGNFQLDPNFDRVELAAFSSLSRAVLNLHETITRF